jgi:hypothetical protein
VRPAVLAAFPAFTKRFEGDVPTMYVDVRRLVTVAWGNLIDPLPMALGLPWLRRADDQPASSDAIAAEWHLVKDGALAAGHGPRELYLSAESCTNLALARMQQNEGYLARRWRNWADWSADAQLGAHSCAWAAGAAWVAPHFDIAVATLDFSRCAGEGSVDDADAGILGARGEAWLNDGFPARVARPFPAGSNPGLRPRNLANKLLFANAAKVLSLGLDRNFLNWPGTP